jgi:hypothetical protein
VVPGNTATKGAFTAKQQLSIQVLLFLVVTCFWLFPPLLKRLVTEHQRYSHKLNLSRPIHQGTPHQVARQLDISNWVSSPEATLLLTLLQLAPLLHDHLCSLGPEHH